VTPNETRTVKEAQTKVNLPIGYGRKQVSKAASRSTSTNPEQATRPSGKNCGKQMFHRLANDEEEEDNDDEASLFSFSTGQTGTGSYQNLPWGDCWVSRRSNVSKITSRNQNEFK
jgi:hypothetical protein